MNDVALHLRVFLLLFVFTIFWLNYGHCKTWIPKSHTNPKIPFFFIQKCIYLDNRVQKYPSPPWKPRRRQAIHWSIMRDELWQYSKLFMISNVCHQLKYKTHRCLFVWVHSRCARSWLQRGKRKASQKTWRRFISSGIWCTCHVCKFNGRST